MTTTRRSSPLYEVNNPPTPRFVRLWAQFRAPALVGVAFFSGPAAGALVIGTGRLLVALSGAEPFPNGLCMLGMAATLFGWVFAGITVADVLARS